jgi:nucleoside-diphosphate-sugar epimerase
MKRNILLTGGSGFIGRNFFEFFSSEYKIFKPSHTEINLLSKDEVRNFIKSNNIGTVIHTAVDQSSNNLNSTLFMYLAIYNSIDLLDRFINFGSGAEYSKSRDLVKVKESELGVSIPDDQYGLSKLICSKLAYGNRKVVTLLPFGVFGKYENYCCKFISNAIVKNLLGLPIKIKQNVIFDYLYIDDLMKIMAFLLKDKDIYGDFNITPDNSIDLLGVTNLINDLSKNKSNILVENKGYNYQYTGSNLNIKRQIKMEFMYYEEAVKELMVYYKLNLKSIDRRVIVEDEYFLKSKIRR